MAAINATLDHVIILIPYDTLKNPPAWITDNFTLSPGGRHADNKTENRLVIFRDGSYIEFIAFINDDPEKRHGHWWDKPYGVVDFAFGSNELVDHAALNERLKKSGTDISYAEPKAGGRSTGGKDIKWKVTFPKGVGRGQVPFWCEDVTDRDWRVPITEENTTHPSGALGVAGVLLEVEKDILDRLSTATAAILDAEKHAGTRYAVGSPKKVESLKKPTIRLQERSKESSRDLALTLLLQSGTQNPRDGIKERIGDGLVSISFE